MQPKSRQRLRRLPVPALCAIVVLAIAFTSCRTDPKGDRSAVDPSAKPSQNATHFEVTPVKGPSWLHHLNLSVEETRLGRMGGSEPASDTAGRESRQSSENALGAIMRRFLGRWLGGQAGSEAILDETFRLSGADLYRLNCQSCHGPSGEGAPPQINAILDPVRGTSAALMMARMKERGTPIDQEMADQLADQAGQTIRQRLEKGGKKMPPFTHLRGDEIEALMTYLRQLAGAPSSADDVEFVSESAARVGEHVIKGTCHTCHGATGPGSGHMAMMRGVIPSLASMPSQLSLDSVVLQVENGSSSMMRGMMGGGGMGDMMGGRPSRSSESRQLMPAFPYFTEPEVAAAYFYLSRYTPQP